MQAIRQLTQVERETLLDVIDICYGEKRNFFVRD